MEQPNAMDDLEADGYEDDGFEGDGLEAETSSFEEGFDATDDSGFDAAGEGADDESADLAGDDQEGFDNELWDAFETDVADALDAGDTDEFLGRIMGALGSAARLARRAQPVARAVGSAASGVGQLSSAAQQVAQMLGNRQWAQRMGTVSNVANRVSGAANWLGGLMGQGFDDFEAFDAMVDLYEDGVDEALPAVVGLAARGLARGLGHRTVANLGQAARRAVVQGVARAARTLVGQHGAAGARTLGRLAARTGHVARRHAQRPAQLMQHVRRGLPRTAHHIARHPQTVHRLARPMGHAARHGGHVHGHVHGRGQGRPAQGAGPAYRPGARGPGASYPYWGPGPVRPRPPGYAGHLAAGYRGPRPSPEEGGAYLGARLGPGNHACAICAQSRRAAAYAASSGGGGTRVFRFGGPVELIVRQR